MDKLFQTACFLLVVLLFASGTLEIKLVEGNICSEGLGQCSGNDDCDPKCKSRHPSVSSSGSCDYTIQPPLCTCSYSCGSSPPAPPPKRNCNGSGGRCSARCNTACCNANCAAKYNYGAGYCVNIAGIYLCQCQYVC